MNRISRRRLLTSPHSYSMDHFVLRYPSGQGTSVSLGCKYLPLRSSFAQRLHRSFRNAQLRIRPPRLPLKQSIEKRRSRLRTGNTLVSFHVGGAKRTDRVHTKVAAQGWLNLTTLPTSSPATPRKYTNHRNSCQLNGIPHRRPHSVCFSANEHIRSR